MGCLKSKPDLQNQEPEEAVWTTAGGELWFKYLQEGAETEASGGSHEGNDRWESEVGKQREREREEDASRDKHR